MATYTRNKRNKFGPSPSKLTLLLLIPLGFPGLRYYVEMSRGAGTNFVEIPNASDSRLLRELEGVRSALQADEVISDSHNVVLVKFESLYAEGKRFQTPVRDFAHNVSRRSKQPRASIVRRFFDLKDASRPGERNAFAYDLQVDEPTADQSLPVVLKSTATQSVLNRRSSSLHPGQNVIAERWDRVKNHLIFIESDRGKTSYVENRLLTSLFPLERDEFSPDKTSSAIGRHLLFRVVNPSEKVRLLLSMTTIAQEGKRRQLPPAFAIGASRQPIPFVGAGAARAVSPPLSVQRIDGVPYIALDMGVEGAPFKNVRHYMKGLFGLDVPLDYRIVVGLTRDISLIGDEEYQRFTPPAEVHRLPADLSHPDLEFSGIYEDGWLSTHAFVVLGGSKSFEPLTIRLTIPKAGNPDYQSKVTVHVDQRPVLEQTLAVGQTDLIIAAPHVEGRRRVDLRFDNVQQLFDGDDRSIPALLNCIGFGAEACPEEKAPPGKDIFGDGLFRGSNWYPRESAKGSSFRWIGQDAVFLMRLPAAGRDLFLEAEPGPASSGQPVTFSLQGTNGKIFKEFTLDRRRTIQFRVPREMNQADGFYPILLRVAGSNKPVGSDKRLLNLRFFRVSFEAPPGLPDIVPPGSGLKIGSGWYLYETYEGKTFRWVDTDAVLKVPPNFAASGLTLHLEPGPGLAGKPLKLRVVDSAGRTVKAFEVKEPSSVFLPLRKTHRAQTLRLRVRGGGAKAAGDPRALNFRVFRITLAR